ncbi:hydroxymethylglutaryl-CoA lyase [Actinorugispora endophytica]|uniref:Hydroxymethylglutaryl-CoA lyase n=1 Tax=Actinorugispora endophytica TaxID=1605990 RepID=A0A4V3D978_9ACTN|nr:hydroxymethylglutaryl-CoA lyase [Actinorugispora endophytica]TDQ55020.1 hydroxymethylglutaryl-CoA lyase [Actinorugispora endophytica]
MTDRSPHPPGLPMAVPQPGLPERVRVYEVGPRDGLQAERTVLSADTKVELIGRLVAAGLGTVEATSFVNPARVPQMADASAVLGALDTASGTRHPVLVPNLRGLDDALAAGAREIAVFLSVTESFSRANLGRPRAEAEAEAARVVARARQEGLAVRGYLSMVFGDPWEGPVPIGEVVAATRRLRDLGAESVSLGDTIGVGTPGHVKALVAALDGAGVPLRSLALHAHDTYGQALANVYAALEAGVSEFDASTGGVGGCPFARSATGNLATEDLVWMLRGLGIETGVDLDALVQTSTWLAAHLGRPSPSRVVAALKERK